MRIGRTSCFVSYTALIRLSICRCEFWVNATHPDLDSTARTRGRSGYVSSPRHTLAPNTTCTYHFRGHPRDHIWLYFVSYSHTPLLPNNTHNCSTRLRIWDGGKFTMSITTRKQIFSIINTLTYVNVFIIIQFKKLIGS